MWATPGRKHRAALAQNGAAPWAPSKAAADTWTAVGSSLSRSGPGASCCLTEPAPPSACVWWAGAAGVTYRARRPLQCCVRLGWPLFLRLLLNSGFSQVPEGSLPLLLSLSPIFSSFLVFSSSTFSLASCSFCCSLVPSSCRSPSAFRASRILSPPSAGISFPPDSSPFGTAALVPGKPASTQGLLSPSPGELFPSAFPPPACAEPAAGGPGAALCGSAARWHRGLPSLVERVQASWHGAGWGAGERLCGAAGCCREERLRGRRAAAEEMQRLREMRGLTWGKVNDFRTGRGAFSCLQLFPLRCPRCNYRRASWSCRQREDLRAKLYVQDIIVLLHFELLW